MSKLLFWPQQLLFGRMCVGLNKEESFCLFYLLVMRAEIGRKGAISQPPSHNLHLRHIAAVNSRFIFCVFLFRIILVYELNFHILYSVYHISATLPQSTSLPHCRFRSRFFFCVLVFYIFIDLYILLFTFYWRGGLIEGLPKVSYTLHPNYHDIT